MIPFNAEYVLKKDKKDRETIHTLIMRHKNGEKWMYSS